MFDVGFAELVLISIIGLLVLGPQRLPKVAAQIGKWVGRARRTATQLRRQLEREIELSELETPPQRPAPPPQASSPPPPQASSPDPAPPVANPAPSQPAVEGVASDGGDAPAAAPEEPVPEPQAKTTASLKN